MRCESPDDTIRLGLVTHVPPRRCDPGATARRYQVSLKVWICSDIPRDLASAKDSVIQAQSFLQRSLHILRVQVMPQRVSHVTIQFDFSCLRRSRNKNWSMGRGRPMGPEPGSWAQGQGPWAQG